MDWLFAHKVVQHDARSMATFLKGERTLNRRRIGEFLGETLVPFHMEVLEAYVASCNFGGLKFAQALRRFLTTFHLPGEAQKIERIVEAFASQYHTCNPGVFAHEVGKRGERGESLSWLTAFPSLQNRTGHALCAGL
jgi:Sec7-like guanine-nucleotide exchange factor